MQEYNDKIARRATVRATSRFPVLRTLSTVAQVAGWILLVGGGVVFILAMVAWLAALGGGQDMSGVASIFAFGAMVPSIIAVLIGFFSVLFAETAKVFMGIEQNTFHMVEQRGDYERRLQQEGEP